MRGILCPACGCADIRTTHTIRHPGSVKRYRQCRYCGRKMITREKLEKKEEIKSN